MKEIVITYNHTYEAIVNYHRTDDLKPEAPPNGTKIIVTAGWKAEDDESFAGEWIFLSDGYPWMPQRDLIIIKEV